MKKIFNFFSETKKVALTCVVLFLLVNNIFAQPCLNPWTYRVPIIVNNTGANLSNHQVSFEINTSTLVSTGKLQSTGGDIRITDNSGSALPFWIENGTMNTTQTRIWVKMTTISNGSNTIYLFYGNPSAFTFSNGAATFNSFDDFNGSVLNNTLWTSCISGGGSVIVNGGAVTISSPDASNTSITSVGTFSSSNAIIEMNVSSYLENVSGQAFLGKHLASRDGYSMKIRESGTGLVAETGKLSASGCGVINSAVGGSTGTSAVGIWSFRWTVSGVISSTTPSTSNSSNDVSFSPGTVNAVIGQSGSTGNFSVDWFRIRNFAAIQPSCLVGSEATLSPPSITASNNGPACSTANSIQLSTTTVTGASYSWIGPGGFTSNLQNPIVSALSSAKSGIYTVITTLGPCASSTASTNVSIFDATVGGTVSNPGSICATSNSGTLNLSGETGSVLYWESANSPLGPFTTINNTSTSLAFGNLNSTTSYRAVVQNGVCPSTVSSTSTLTVDQASDGGNLLGTNTICTNNSNATLSLSNNIGSIQKWQVSFNGSIFQDIPVSTPSITHTDNNVGVYDYRVIIKNTSCPEDTSNIASITVNPLSVSGTLTGSTTVCASSNSGSIILSGNTGNIVRWESSFNNNVPWTTIANSTSTINYINLNQTVYYRAVVQNAGCTEVQTTSAPIIVDPVTNPGSIVGNTSVCASINQGILTQVGQTGDIQNWQISSDGGATYNNILPASSNLTFTFNNLNAGSYLYRTVVQSGTCSPSFSNPALVIVNPLPQIIFNSDVVCQGIPTTFSNNSTISSGSIVNYFWDFGNGNSSTSVIPNYVFPNSGTYSVQLKGTSNFGCKDSLTISTTVNPKPVPNFSFSNVCLLNAMNFSSFGSVISSGSIASFDWKFGDGNLASGNTSSNNYVSDGNFLVTLVTSSNLGCKDSIAKTVTVYPLPNTAFTNTNVCLGTPTIFTNNSNISSGNLSYLWDFGDGSNSTSTNTSNTYITPLTYSVELTATSNFGCSTSLIQTIDVNPLPDPNFSVIETCPGSPSGFTNTSTITNGNIVSYQWDFGDGTTSTVVNPSKNYSAAGNYVVSLTATSDNGCIQSISQNITVNIGTIVGNVRGNVLGSTAVCTGINGGNLLLTGQTGTIIQWEYQDAGNNTWTIAPSNTNSFSYSNLVATRIFRVLTQYTPCTTEYSDTAIVTVNELPQVDFSALDVCKGQASNFINNSSVPNGNIQSNTWDFGNGASSVLSQPVYIFPNSGSYSVLLTVISDAGCEDTLRKTINIFGTPLVQFSQNNVCLNDSMSFVNTSTVPNGSIAASSWNFGDGNFSSDLNPKHLYTSPGNYSVELIITGDNSCSDSITSTVSVFSRASVLFSADTVCLGSSTHFTNQTFINSGNLTYEWEFGDGNSSILFNPSHTYAQADTFSVQLVATTLEGCKDTLVQDAIVSIQPIADFIVQDVCAYDSAFFTNTSNSGGSLLNYYWDFGDGTSSTLENPIHLFPNAGIFLEKLTVTTPSGCTSTVSKNITINQVPIANFSANNVCDSLPVNFTNLSAIGGGNLIHLWTFGDGNSSSLSNPSYTYAASGTYSIQLISSTSFGCTDTITGNVTVFPRPLVNFGAPSVCEGALSVFSDSSSISSGSILSYLWDFGDGTNSIVRNPTKLYLNAGIYPVNLITNSDKGCSNDTTINAIVNILPVADFNFISECDGDSISYFNLSTISSGIISHQWNFGDGNLSSETSPKHLFNDAGEFQTELLVLSNEGCKDSITKTISVFPIPQPDAGKDTSISQGYAVQLNATGGNSYFWFPSTGLSSSTIYNPKASPFNSTEYILTVVDENGCIGYDTILISIIEDYKIIANNIITPNGDGINDVWKIENITTFNNSELMIFDRWGKLIYKKQGYDNSWGGTSGSDILPDGTYYYVITFETSEKIYKGSITLLRDK